MVNVVGAISVVCFLLLALTFWVVVLERRVDRLEARLSLLEGKK